MKLTLLKSPNWMVLWNFGYINVIFYIVFPGHSSSMIWIWVLQRVFREISMLNWRNDQKFIDQSTMDSFFDQKRNLALASRLSQITINACNLWNVNCSGTQKILLFRNFSRQGNNWMQSYLEYGKHQMFLDCKRWSWIESKISIPTRSARHFFWKFQPWPSNSREKKTCCNKGCRIFARKVEVFKFVLHVTVNRVRTPDL